MAHLPDGAGAMRSHTTHCKEKRLRGTSMWDLSACRPSDHTAIYYRIKGHGERERGRWSDFTTGTFSLFFLPVKSYYAACRTRWRSRSNLARPYPCLLMSLRRVI